MKSSLGAQCDDFYASSRLSLKLDLSLERETVLHFFDRVRREHPSMKRFRRHAEGGLTLEENEPDPRDGEPRRWIRLEPPAIRFGYFAPPSRAAWRRFGQTLLEYAPYYLSLNDLDINHLEVVYGFDLEFSGNHDQLVAETFFADHPLAPFLMGDEGAHVIDCQPYLGITLSETCDVQAYLEIKSRTSTFEVRTSEYEAQLLSVYLTVRRYWGFDQDPSLADAYTALVDTVDEQALQRVVPLVVNPLAMAIASQL
jgi:hypothetical protein